MVYSAIAIGVVAPCVLLTANFTFLYVCVCVCVCVCVYNIHSKIYIYIYIYTYNVEGAEMEFQRSFAGCKSIDHQYEQRYINTYHLVITQKRREGDRNKYII